MFKLKSVLLKSTVNIKKEFVVIFFSNLRTQTNGWSESFRLITTFKTAEKCRKISYPVTVSPVFIQDALTYVYSLMLIPRLIA